jgi:hypothetical protein
VAKLKIDVNDALKTYAGYGIAVLGASAVVVGGVLLVAPEPAVTKIVGGVLIPSGAAIAFGGTQIVRETGSKK